MIIPTINSPASYAERAAKKMKPIELTKQIENPHVYWPAKCGFPDGINSYGEFQIAINWFKENSATFEYVAFRGESKYYDTFCKPAIARQDKDLTREYTKGHIITDQEVEFVLLNFGDYVGHNIFFHSQHFGSLTRLLDVSKAKEVALYFACNSNFDEDGYLYITYASTMIPMWAPEVKSLEEILSYYDFMSRDDVCYVLETYNSTQRMRAQFGVFICWTDPIQIIPAPVYVIKVKGSAKVRILNEIVGLG